MNEKKNVWEVIVRVVIAALSAALTAITTTASKAAASPQTPVVILQPSVVAYLSPWHLNGLKVHAIINFLPKSFGS